MSIVSEANGGVKRGEFTEIIKIDERKVRPHVEEVVRQSVEETLNGLLDAEADELCGAKRYERSVERLDTRAGHYERKLHTKAGEISLKVPRLRNAPFETQIIERYRRRDNRPNARTTRTWPRADARQAISIAGCPCRSSLLACPSRC
ncbi:MAG: transposase [Thermoguttaceae bacterium]